MTLTTESPPKKPRKPRSAKVIKVEPPVTFPCAYCKRVFALEKTLASHLCEKKRRYLDEDEKHVKLAFWVYNKFYEFHYRRTQPRTFVDFAESKYWTPFVKFGRHLLDLNAVEPKAYVEFLFRNAVPITKWTSATLYATYVRELNKKESPFKALERSVLLMEQWALESGQEAKNFFREITPARAVLWLNSGRISPWLFYAAASSESLLNRMSKEQIALVQEAIDPKFWSEKIAQFPAEFGDMKSYLDEFGI